MVLTPFGQDGQNQTMSPPSNKCCIIVGDYPLYLSKSVPIECWAGNFFSKFDSIFVITEYHVCEIFIN